MNKDLQRGIAKARREKAAYARTIEETRNEGATTGNGDIARHVTAARKDQKAQQAVREALKEK